MKIGVFSILLAILAILASASHADPHLSDVPRPGLAGDTLLIIRHAEKPADKAKSGRGLMPAGEARSKAYADYFRPFRLDGAPIRITTLVATADSANSARPRLTLTPLSRVMDLLIQQPFADEQVDALADWLAKGPPSRTILIAWHHRKIPQLLAALGANPAVLIPSGTWPNDTYDWVVVLRYDMQGKLKSETRLVEPNLNAKAAIAER